MIDVTIVAVFGYGDKTSSFGEANGLSLHRVNRIPSVDPIEIIKFQIATRISNPKNPWFLKMQP